MNRIYQVIWSSVKSCYVVVSENASRHGKKKAAHLAPSTTKRTMLAMSLGVAVLMGSGAAAEAAATGEHATISGGVNGTASGKYSSISGGKDNVAAGENSSISGGSTNKASGINSSVSGGGDNEAIGEEASVSGGSQGKATGKRSSVTGGGQNQAAGDFSTVNGGTGNKAFGYGSSIIGGSGNVVGKMAVDENGNPKFKDSNGNDVVGTITIKEGNPILVDSKGNVIKDAHQYPDPSSPFAASVVVAIGGYSSSVQGSYSVGIAGGSTSASASSGLAAGRQATVTMANGVAIGYESTASVINSSRAADKEGRIVSFGHQAGDVYYTVDYQNHTVTENQYDSAAYNRLVNVADGIDDHDVVVMEQLKNAKAEAVATAKNQIKVKGDEYNVHAEETTDKDGVQTTTISLKPKVTLKDSTDTTGAKQVVLDGTSGTISAGLSTDTKNFISLNGTKGLAKVGGIQIGNQSFTYDYMKPVSLNDDGATLKLESTRASASGNFVTGLSNRTWTPGNYVTGRAATEDQLEQAGRHFLSIKTANKDDDGNPITPVAENSLANYYNDGATGSASMAFGVGTTAKGDHSLSMGVRSSASGLNSLAIGYDNTASGTQSVAVGNGTNASGNYSVAMGLGSQAGTQNTDPESTDNGAAVAVGFESSAEQTGSAAYGYMASANNFESSAFGTSATANADGSVALGAHSVANRDKGISGYLAPTSMTPDNAAIWISTDGVVSLGGKTKNAAGQDVTISRQITNLAAGSEDSDAVNVAQLKALASQGMNFQGNDTNTSVHLDQGGTLQIQGSGRKEDTEYSTQNVKVLTDTANKRLSIALDKNPTFDSVTAGTENGTSGGQAGSIKIVGANSSSTNKATTITAGYAASPELSGTKGTGRISYTDGDGTAHTVATLGDGLKLAGDTGTGSVALDNPLTVSGGAKNLAEGNNIGVTANGSTLSLKLAKDITGLDTVTAGGVKMGTQSDGNDTTKSGKYVTGLDNTTWTVGQTQPVTGRAATEDQLKSVSDVVNTNQTNIATNTEAITKGLNFSASNKVDGTYKTVKKNLGDTVAVRASDVKDGHTYKTDNLTTEIDDNGIITVKMDTQLTADKVTVGTGNNAITIDGSDGSLKTGASTLNGTGLTINDGPRVTKSGISGGSKQITEVKSGASGMDDSNNPIYGTDTNAANIGDVKKIAAKTVTVSGDGKNTKVDKTTNADGTVDYKVSLNDSVTLGSDAAKKIALDGTAGTVSVGDKVTLNGANGTATIGGATLGNDGANTYLTGLTNKTWNPNNITSGRAATEDQLQTVSNTVNAGWEVDVNNSKLKEVTPTSKTVNFVEGKNISITGLNDSITVATKPDVQFTSVYVGGTLNPTTNEYTSGIKIANQAGGGANTSDGNYITGLDNTKWEKDKIVSGRAATEDQLNQVAKTLTGDIKAGDVYVNGGGITYDASGNGTITLDRNNNTPITFKGVKNNYVTGATVSSVRNAMTGEKDPHLTLTRNDGENIDVDLSGMKKYDFRLVQNTASGPDGKYTVQSDGTVDLIVANGDGESETITLQDLASKTTVDQGLNLEGNTKAADGTSYKSVNRKLGNTIAVRASDAKSGHTYTSDNLTTDVDDNGVITVKMDNQVNLGQKNTSEGANDGYDGNLHVTGKSGNYVELNGSDGSFRMGLGDQYASLNQNYGGAKYLKEQGDSSPRFTYTVNGDENTKQTLATLSDGMNYSGDIGKAAVLLNKDVQITGGVTDTDKLTADNDHNIGVVASQNGDNGKLTLKLAKELTGLTSVTAGTAKLGNQTIADSAFGNNNNPKTGNYLTGLDNKNWKADSIVSGRAATEDQLQQVANAIVNGKETGGGFGISDNAGNVVKQDLGGAIQLKAADSNLTTTADTTGKAITFGLSKELKDMTSATFKDATTGAMTVIDGKGIAITPQNGSTNGQVKLTTDGLSNGGKQITNVQSGLYDTAQNKPVDISTITANSPMLQNGATIGDLQTVSNGVKTELTNKGLDFKGNGNTTVHRKLGETLTIQGTGADGRDYDGGTNVQVKADKDANTLTVQLDRDLNAHTLTLGKETKSAEKGEEGSLILNGVNKDNGYSPVSIKAAYKTTEQDTDTSLKTNMSRLTYAVANEGTHTVATLEDGLQLSGDNGEAFNTTLDKKVTIKGGAKDKLVDNTTDPTKNNNIGVVASQDAYGNTTLSLQLSKDIAGLNTVTAGSVVMGNQNVISVGKVSGQGNFVTGLDNKTWDGKDYVSGRAATEDQLYTVSNSIQNTVKGATFAITAGGQGEATDATVTKKVGESIRIFGDAPKVSGGGDGDGWDRSAANILTKVKKDNHGDGYVSVELQDHLEVGVHAGTDTDGKAIEGTDGSMQFKGKAAANEVMVTGDTGVTLKNNGNQAAALHQTDGTGYLDLVGSQGAFTSLFAQQGAQNLASDQDSKSDTRLTYTDKNSKTAHQVATLDDGLIVAGDNGQVTRLLNSTLKLSGGETDTTKLSNGKNIGVVANKDNDGLDIKLAKDLTDIDSINMTGGLKLNSTNGSSTITGLTNTSVDLPDFGKAGRAATEEQLEQVKGSITDAAKGGGFGLADDKGNAIKADLGSNIGIHGDNNITTAVSEDGKSLNIGLKKDVDLGDAGSIKAGGVTIDKNGIDAGGKNITNVKSGIVKGDDSDNGNAANIGDVKHIVDGKIGDVNGKIDNITKDVSNIKTDVSTIKQTKRTYQGDDGKVVNVDFGGALSLTGGATEVAEDKNIGVVKNGENGLSLRLAKNLGGLESVTTGKTTMDDSGLTIAGSDGKASTTVTNSGIKIASSGDDTHAVEISNSNVSMGGQQIHDVAPGAADGDAVNVSQLKKSVGALGGAINQVDRRVDRVGAGAAALAALHPQDFDPDDKWDFAVGYGNYRGANAAAVGAFYKPNEDTTFSVGGTVGGGENMVNAGISFKFGQGNHVSNSRVAMAKEIKDLRKEVESLRSALVDVAAGKQLDPAKTKLFPDMPKNHWAYKEISELAGNGLLDGYPDGEFKGDRMMTRYEFATIVYRQMMAGRELSDRLVQEFEPELERIRIDVVARHKDGTPSIERVRVNKPADANRK